MEIIKTIIRCIGLVILWPFKILNKFCIFSEESDIPKTIMAIISVVISSLYIVLKLWPFDSVSIVMGIILVVILNTIILTVFIFVFSMLIEALKFFTDIPTDLFDEIQSNLNKREKVVKKSKSSNTKYKNEERSRRKSYSIKKEKDATVDLAYFIEKERNVKTKYVKIIN